MPDEGTSKSAEFFLLLWEEAQGANRRGKEPTISDPGSELRLRRREQEQQGEDFEQEGRIDENITASKKRVLNISSAAMVEGDAVRQTVR